MRFNENRAFASASPAPAEPAPFDLPDAAPWPGSWSHLIAAWLFGAVVLAGQRRLHDAFRRYRNLCGDPPWRQPSLACRGRKLSIGDLRLRSRGLIPRPRAGRVAAAVPEPAQACGGGAFCPIRRSPPVGSAAALWSCVVSITVAWPLQLPLRLSSLLRCRTTPPISWPTCSRSSCFGIAVT